MARPRFAVTMGLVLAGSGLGAICGLLALAPIPIIHALHPTPDDAFVVVSEAALWAAGIGTALGAVCAPVFGWTLLRRAPIWRVLLEPTLGTLLGSLVGWVLAFTGWLSGIPAILSVAFAGTAFSALRLRYGVRRMSTASDRDAAI